MNYFPKFDRHLTILLLAQAISGSTTPVLFLISGLLGPRIAPTPRLSTLPMSLVVVGIALASPLASYVMSKIGRKNGHLVGIFTTLIGVAVAGLSLAHMNFIGYSLGCLISGIGGAFNNQIRFTAAEAAGPQKALVHSWILMFSLFAAFLGPWTAKFGHELLSYGEYTGSTAMLFGFLLVVGILMSFLPQKNPIPPTATLIKKVSTGEILRNERFWLGALCGITSFATMTLLMSATPLQMHEFEHFSIAETTTTIQSHIVAMFLPSLFSGVLLSWLGIRRLIELGVSLFMICIGVALSGHHFHHYWWALVLLGVGWNFLFLASSTWISLSFSGPERFATQGVNDGLVYGTQSVASLAAGWALFQFGWQTLVLIPIPILLTLLIFVWLKRAQIKKVA